MPGVASERAFHRLVFHRARHRVLFLGEVFCEMIMSKTTTITVSTEARDAAKRAIIGTKKSLKVFGSEALIEKSKRAKKTEAA